MPSNYAFFSQKLASLCHTLLLFFSFISTNISRLRMFDYFFKKNNKDTIFLEPEEEEDDSGKSLQLKFKFPTFDEFSRRGNLSNYEAFSSNKFKFVSGKNSVSAFIEVLTTFSVKEITAHNIAANFLEVDEKTRIKNGKIEAIEFQKKTENNSELVKEVEDYQDFVDYFSEKNSDGFLSDGDFGEELDNNFDDEENEIKNVEKDDLHYPVGLESEFLSEKDFHEDSGKKKDGGFVSMGGDHSDKPQPDSDSVLEPLWEHQELIEQLQMELRKAKATGLPSILEEPESPKIMDELKPWRIDDNFQHENCMGELHKFYKSYREMMRRFDILNYQKMYAMGFLQLKDPFQSNPSAPTLKSLVSQNLWLFKHKIHGSDPVKKFVSELQGDLEVVYVGQTCLSWEFLHWQYEKALDLWNSDPHGVHRYNEVAGEFQQFQVLVQRFTENEPFQGPRVESYVKSRCVLRNLLQVPLIREDCFEEKNKRRRKERDEYGITSEMLVEMVEESIGIFWQFVRSDKEVKKMPDLHSPQDLKLLQQVRRTLQKKEKKMKDILRSEKCILRKFRQSRDDDESDQVLHFSAQVDVKLVSRVVNMSRISKDQLIWCQNKLRRIRFENRKIYVQPGFTLFPC